MAVNPEVEKGLKDVRDNEPQGKSVFSPLHKDHTTGGQKRVFPAGGSVAGKFKEALSKFKKR